MIVSVFVRRLKEGRTFAEFVEEWEADRGFGVPTRVFNAQSIDDPRDVVSVGFVAMDAEDLREGLAAVAAQEQVRHERIDSVIESTTIRCLCELRTEHDFAAEPAAVAPGSPESLLAALARQ